jgi:translation initiation factor IF-3
MIRIRQVRLIDDGGNQVGVVDADEARRVAREKGLDLVEVSPEARPPVCKIMDYGKFKYDQKKKEHDSRKRQHKVQVKEIRLRPKIGQHDIDYKLKKAIQFLEAGDKVQLNMLFRGREMAHLDVGREKILNFAKRLTELCKVERMPKMEGRRMTMLLTSLKNPNPK